LYKLCPDRFLAQTFDTPDGFTEDTYINFMQQNLVSQDDDVVINAEYSVRGWDGKDHHPVRGSKCMNSIFF
jgi:hypothetical protein